VRAHRWPLLRAAAVAAAAALLAACGPAPAPAPIPPAATRPVAFTRCPDIALTIVPPGLTKTNSVVEALYGNHMGNVITYATADGRRQLKTYSGVDLLDVLDDLDFSARAVRVGGRDFVLHRTTAIPDMLVAEVEAAGQRPPCDNLFVQSRHLPRGQVLEVLRGLELRQAG
jgi:hypothetical protein